MFFIFIFGDLQKQHANNLFLLDFQALDDVRKFCANMLNPQF
jgi:hypothetical protein